MCVRRTGLLVLVTALILTNCRTLQKVSGPLCILGLLFLFGLFISTKPIITTVFHIILRRGEGEWGFIFSKKLDTREGEKKKNYAWALLMLNVFIFSNGKFL